MEIEISPTNASVLGGFGAGGLGTTLGTALATATAALAATLAGAEVIAEWVDVGPAPSCKVSGSLQLNSSKKLENAALRQVAMGGARA